MHDNARLGRSVENVDAAVDVVDIVLISILEYVLEIQQKEISPTRDDFFERVKDCPASCFCIF